MAMTWKVIGLLTTVMLLAAVIFVRPVVFSYQGVAVSPYVRAIDLNLSLEELRRIALGDLSSSGFTPDVQEEYIMTTGQWFEHCGCVRLVTDRRSPVYILRRYGDTGLVTSQGVEATMVYMVVDFKERYVFAGGIGRPLSYEPIDVNVLDTGKTIQPMPQIVQTLIWESYAERATYPTPETTADPSP